MTELRVADSNDPDKIHVFHFINGLPLNKTNPDLLINFIAYQEIKGDKIKEFNRQHVNLLFANGHRSGTYKANSTTFTL